MTPSYPSQKTNVSVPTSGQPSVLPRDFELQTKSLVSRNKPGSIHAGWVSIIGLDRVKERFGPGWTRLANRADRITRNTIQRYLIPGDIFSAFGETNYAIVFSTLDEEQARVKCAMIAEEVMKALVGEDGGDLISIRSAVGTLADASGLADFMSRGPEDTDDAICFEETTQETPPPNLAVTDEPHFVYRPMWDTTNAVLATYLIAVDETSGARGSPNHGENSDAYHFFDLSMQQAVFAELDRLSKNGRKVLIALTFHFGTLGNASHRRHYIEALENNLPRDLANMLLIEIADMPDGVPHSRLYDIATPLRRYCRALVARLRLESLDFGALRDAGIAAVGCDVDGHSATEFGIIQLMSRFNRAAEKLRLATYVTGLRSVSLAAAAVGSGFRYIEGSKIGERIEHPDRIVPFTLPDLYRSLLQA
jgi:hypothetical protein